MKLSQIFTAGLLSLFLLVQGIPASHAEALPFPDVQSPILQEAVGLLVERGIIDGYPDGTFHPERTVNRAEALKMISLVTERQLLHESRRAQFSDVSPDQWFADYVTTAAHFGEVQGYKDGTFKPFQDVSRGEFMKIALYPQDFYRIPNMQEVIETLHQFTDVQADDWFLPFLSAALKAGFWEGKGGFLPHQGMTRGEAAVMMAAILRHRDELRVAYDERKRKERFDMGCEKCVHGIDLSVYAWLDSPAVQIADGKIQVGNFSDTTDYLKKGVAGLAGIRELWLTAHWSELRKHTPREEKLLVDQLFPQLYQRALDITGGAIFQPENKYLYGGSKNPIRVQDGTPLRDCECLFEKRLYAQYNGFSQKPELYNPNGLDFQSLMRTDDGKVLIYDAIEALFAIGDKAILL